MTRHSRHVSALRHALAAPATPPGGLVRRVARRIDQRLGRPRDEVNQSLLLALLDLDRRVRDLEDEELPALTDELIAGLEDLRERMTAANELVAGSRALPYAAGEILQELRDPRLGTVLGFRRAEATAAGTETYRRFEDIFRGPEQRVAERQRVYLSLLSDHSPVLDTGCGRGEFLDMLRESGIEAHGVDLDPGMVERSRAKGHQVDQADVCDHLEAQPSASLGAVFSAQLIEHLPTRALLRYFELARDRLRPGGVLIAETVNPHAPHALKTFWVDPTHQHPLFPEAIVVLLRLAGYVSAYAWHPLGWGHVAQDRHRESEYSVMATR